MAQAPLCIFEVGNNLATATGASGLLNRLWTRNVDVAPITAGKFSIHVPAVGGPAAAPASMLVGDLDAVCSFNFMRSQNSGMTKTLNIAEMMIPGMEDTKFMDQADSRNEIVKIVKYSATETGFENWEAARATIRLYTEAPAAAGGARTITPLADINGNPLMAYKAEMPVAGVSYVQGNGDLDMTTVGQWNYEFCGWLLGVLGYTENRRIRQRVRESICEVIIGLCKQGNCTNKWLTSAVADLTSNFGSTVDITSERVKQVYGVFNNYVTPENMRHITTVWIPKLDNSALKLKTVIQQASGAGTTCAKIIAKAVTSFPELPWAVISDIIGGGELNQANLAIHAFAQDEFAGFSSTTMNAHGSKHYRKLAWVARYVLVNYAGDASLNGLTGKSLPDDIPASNVILPIINHWHQQNMGQFAIVAGAIPAATPQSTATIQAATNNQDWITLSQ